jgi:hypothetical protein
MRATIDLPDALADEISTYLQEHDDMSLERLVERALRREIAQPNPEALLAMVNLVGRFPPPDRIPPEERQPEDRITDYVP